MERNGGGYKTHKSNPDAVKKKVVDEVSKGKSLRQTAKDNKLPLSTVAHWCKEDEVQSQHSRSPIKATDKEIIAEIRKKKVCTVPELEKKFGYHTNALRRRLNNLIKKEKIDFLVISGGGGKVALLFKGYVDKRIYYVNKNDLNKWIKSKLPKDIPGAFKRAISLKLHDSGIPFEFKKVDKKALVVEAKLYERIKKKATNNSMSMSEYVKKNLK